MSSLYKLEAHITCWQPLQFQASFTTQLFTKVLSQTLKKKFKGLISTDFVLWFPNLVLYYTGTGWFTKNCTKVFPNNFYAKASILVPSTRTTRRRTPTNIFQKGVYYKSEIWHIDFTYNLKTSPKTVSLKVEFDTEDPNLVISYIWVWWRSYHSLGGDQQIGLGWPSHLVRLTIILYLGWVTNVSRWDEYQIISGWGNYHIVTGWSDYRIISGRVAIIYGAGQKNAHDKLDFLGNRKLEMVNFQRTEAGLT